MKNGEKKIIFLEGWKKYQHKKYPRNLINNNSSDFFVICGHISNNLVVFDYDIDKTKEFNSDELYDKIIEIEPRLKNTLTIRTQSGGLHFHVQVESMECYNMLSKNKDIPCILKEISHIDVQGEKKIAILWREIINQEKPLKITNLEFFEILSKFTKKEEKALETIKKKNNLEKKTIDNIDFNKLDKPYRDFLKGNFYVNEYSKNIGIDEFHYWKDLFWHVLKRLGLYHYDLYSILEKNQPEFSKEKTEEQLRYKKHDYRLTFEQGFIKKSKKELYPEYYKKTEKKIEDFVNLIDENSPTEKINEIFELLPRTDIILQGKIFKIISENIGDSITKTEVKRQYKIYIEKIIKKEKEQEEKKEEMSEIEIPEEFKPAVDELLSLENKFIQIEKILDFYIFGEKENKILLFILLSGSYFKLYSIIALIGVSSGGKSFLSKNVIEPLFPKSDYKYLTGSSDRYLIYLAKNDQHYEILFFNEVQRNKEIIEQMKDFGDDGIAYGTVEHDALGNYVPVDLNLGMCSVIVTTTNEFINMEFLNRAWRLEPDETKELNVKIVERDYRNKKYTWKRDKKETIIKEKANVIKFALQTIKNEYDFDEINIPFTESLIKLLNLNVIQVRRDKDKLTDLIKRVTAWNYRIRSYIIVNNKKHVLAHPNDLKTVMHYAVKIFVNMTQNLTPERIKIVNRINVMSQDKEKQHRLVDIYTNLKKNGEFGGIKDTLRHKLNYLVNLGYLDKSVNPNDKRSNLYESLSGDLKHEQDVNAIIEDAIEEYNEFIEEIKKNEEITFTEVKIQDFEYPENINDFECVKETSIKKKVKKQPKEKDETPIEVVEKIIMKEENPQEKILIKSIEKEIEMTGNPIEFNWLYEVISAKKKGFSHEELKKIISNNPNLKVKEYKDGLEYVEKIEKGEP